MGLLKIILFLNVFISPQTVRAYTKPVKDALLSHTVYTNEVSVV